MLRLFLYFLFVCVLSGCQSPCDPIATAPHIQEEETSPPPPRPYKKKVRNKPSYPSKLMQRVNLQITEHVPLRAAITELARQKGINLQMDASINGPIVFTANDRPFMEVIEGICELASLRFEIVGESVRIVPDTPYSKNYNVQFLNLARTSDSRISIATDVFSHVQDQKASLDNGSNSVVEGKVENSFWAELEQNLEMILDDSAEEGGRYTVHKQGGLISVRGTQKQHRLIENYLELLRVAASTQVLIEAKVVEVTLKDEHKAGINWHNLLNNALHLHIPLANIAQRKSLIDPTSGQGDMLSVGVQNQNFSAILKAIHEFGSAKTLSSPRITVMNNQNAILKVAQNQVYFRLNYDRQYSMNVNRENVSVSSDILTVPIGLVMSVQPSIDHETGEVIMSLRPTVSRLSKSVSDPAVDIIARSFGENAASIKPSLIPVVEVREIDSVLRIKSGECAILGGLMENRNSCGEAKLPIAGDIPVLGALFKANSTSQETIELVILLKATIIDDAHEITPADRRLYEEVACDPRPLKS